ncbi:MAG TPA: DUF4214 domain-containing protein, partial [Bryobacteraceae bacterium]|nr:DUF4214 domain-containing protein [Bryobacteraceae bacterium]
MRATAFRGILPAVVGLVLSAPVADAQTSQVGTAGYWVTANYIAVLGRMPDAGGWIYWTDTLTGVNQAPGQPLGTISQLTSSFLSSGEYCGFFSQPAGCSNPPSDGDFITLLYENALDRSASQDPTGYAFWLNQLAPPPQGAGLTRVQVVTDFIQSTEFASKHGLNSPTPNAATYCSGYTNSVAYASSPTVSAGVEQILTFTFANYCGQGDISGGQVWITNSNADCNVGWDTSGTITPYDTSGCSVNVADSSVSKSSANPKAWTLTLATTFAQTSMVGTFEVWGQAEDSETISTGMIDLGAIAISYGPDFTLSISPSLAEVPSGQSTTFTITATGLAGYTGPVNLSLQSPTFVGLVGGLPALQANQSQTVTFMNEAPTGEAGSFVIAGSTPQSPNVVHSVFAQLTSAGIPATIQLGLPSPATLVAGASVTVPVYVTPSNGTVDLTVAGLPPGGWYSLTQNPPASSPVSLTINAPSTAPAGTYSVTVCGNSSTCNSETVPSSTISLAVDVP